jgi:hypothetical protein
VKSREKLLQKTDAAVVKGRVKPLQKTDALSREKPLRKIS